MTIVSAPSISRVLARWPSWLLAGTAAMTLALALPLVYWPPSTLSSPEPPGEVFEVRNLLSQRFAPGDYRMLFIVEGRGGNVLSRQALLELQTNCERLRRAPGLGALLAPGDPAGDGGLPGLSTLADAVDRRLDLTEGLGLAEATEPQVAATVAALLAEAGPAAFGLSAHTQNPQPGREGRWESPALAVYVTADNDALGGGGLLADLGTTDTRKEEFARDVLALLRGDQRHIEVWGLALDANLTSLEQGRSAGPYIAGTVAAVLLLLMAFFRSYWTLAVTGAALGALMMWIKGLSNLVGLKEDQILTTIVPIAMISFGIDFAFHAVGRYREERATTPQPRRALESAWAGVLGALLVVLISDMTAFLSNMATGIESLVHFALAASLAAMASFWLLGVATPAAVMVLDERVPLGRAALGGWAGALLATLAATATVVLTAFVSPPGGVAAWCGYLVLFLVAPAALRSRRTTSGLRTAQSPVPPREPTTTSWLTSGAVALTRRRRLVLAVALAGTAGCAYLAHQVKADFDVRDYFAASTDFVVGLDKFDRHVGQQGGEPALVYVEGDLADPAVAQGLTRFVDEVRRLDTTHLAQGPDGSNLIRSGLVELLENAQAESPRPLSRHQLQEVYHQALAQDQGGPGGARRFLWFAAAPPRNDRRWGWGATVVELRVPGSRQQENIVAARRALEPPLATLRDDLQARKAGSRVVLTGRPITRQASLEAVLWAFRLSIPIALVLCLVVASLFMRSWRQGIATVIPVAMVVTWLYAIMHVWGYSLNVVTATIGALSIGIGVDFSAHLALRYREECQRRRDREDALRKAIAGTGRALAASAMSSIAGFALLAFAPMPMFAAYGALTALMILLTLCASLFVLPSLLLEPLFAGAPTPGSGTETAG